MYFISLTYGKIYIKKPFYHHYRKNAVFTKIIQHRVNENFVNFFGNPDMNK